MFWKAIESVRWCQSQLCHDGDDYDDGDDNGYDENYGNFHLFCSLGGRFGNYQVFASQLLNLSIIQLDIGKYQPILQQIGDKFEWFKYIHKISPHNIQT